MRKHAIPLSEGGDSAEFVEVPVAEWRPMDVIVHVETGTKYLVSTVHVRPDGSLVKYVVVSLAYVPSVIWASQVNQYQLLQGVI